MDIVVWQPDSSFRTKSVIPPDPGELSAELFSRKQQPKRVDLTKVTPPDWWQDVRLGKEVV